MMDGSGNYDFEAVIVENGSTDLSYRKLSEISKRDPRFKVLRLSRNFGCDGGISAGLHYVKGDAAVIMNADLQDPPEMIPAFLKKWEEGYEIVYGEIQKREGVTFFRKLFSSLFYEVINRLTGGLFPKNASDFRLIDKKVYRSINQFSETNRFLRGMIAWTGFSQTGIPFNRPPRFAGKAKAGIGAIWRVALNGIYAFSYFPLKVVTLLGMAISFFSFLAIILYIVLFFMYGRVVPGFMTLLTVMLFLFGTLFLILGIIGEYLSRIYDEVKKRPNYIIKETIGL
jgi:dolichol-phosphate mannosyltransferase